MNSQFDENELRKVLGEPTVGLEGRWARPILWMCLLVFIAFIGWSNWAEVNEVARGEGQVVPSSRQQTIQSLEGGILEELLVKEGAIVEAGDPLVLLNKTRFRTAYFESINQALGLKAAIARLEAEVWGKKKIEFPPEITANGSVARTERELFKARNERLKSSVDSIKDEIKVAMRQLEVVEPLVRRKALGEMEALRLKREVASLKGRKADTRHSFVQDAYAELADKKSELAALEQVIEQRKDQLERTKVVSPVRGVVNSITITTVGGVIPPGEEIMQITPLEDSLVFETKIRPADVAFIAPGMPATIRISAYDYSVYGVLEGEVLRISSDTLEEQTANGKESYYRVLVKSTQLYLEHNNKKLPIKPGMLAEVDIETGTRSVLSYLLRPFTRLELR